MIANRLKAFSVHLLGSCVVACLSAALVYLVWYPRTLADASGVTSIFLLLLAVDVVVGPCITFVVFNTAKKELRRDLAIVLLLQLAALAYGLHAVYVARPAYLIYNAGRFDLVFANDLTPERLETAVDATFRTVPSLGPQTIAAKPPADSKTRTEILMSSLTTGEDLPLMPKYYVPYESMREDIKAKLQPIDALANFNQHGQAAIEALRSRYAGRIEQVGYMPMRGKVQDLSVVIDRQSGDILEVSALAPW